MATINTLQLLAIASAAFRINGYAILKESTTDKIANGIMVKYHINEPSKSKLEVMSEDIEQAQVIKDYVTQRITISRLTGKPVSEFIEQIAMLLDQDTANVREAGIVTWAPKVYADLVKTDEQQVEFSSLGVTSKFIGCIGDKITLDFTTVSRRWNQNFGCWRYSGHDGKGNLIGFLSKTDYPAQVCIKGRIKAHEQSRFTNGKTTYINYTKQA